MRMLSNIARGFSEEKFWKVYSISQKSSGLKKTLFTSRYMRMAAKQGGYIGHET